MKKEHIKVYFPCDKEINEKLKTFCSCISNSLIVSTIDRQAYSERQRYHVKEDVDEALLKSPFVEKEGSMIKQICLSNDTAYIDNYLNLLKNNMNNLVDICFDFMDNFQLYTTDSIKFETFLIKYLEIADFDNAHAMYLSSDNWDFSVFNSIIKQLSNKYKNPKDFENILQGNILDIRTVAYIWKDKYNFTEDKSISILKTIKDYNCIENNHIMPILLFQYGTKKLQKLPIEKNIQLSCILVEKYQDLYYARFLYDSIEYFGFYGFIRNLIAEICAKNINTEIANHITLYQFYDAYTKLEKRSLR